MKNKFDHIRDDKCLLKSDLIVLTETWLEQTQSTYDQYQLTDYKENLNCIGRGRGIASYFNLKFKHTQDINYDGCSISKSEAEKLDVIGIYRSQEGNIMELISKLEDLITEGKTTVIGGDMNICALAHPKNYLSATLRQKGFEQLVKRSTHIEGGMIDHIYIIQGEKTRFSYKVVNFPKYYSDHDGLGIILSEE